MLNFNKSKAFLFLWTSLCFLLSSINTNIQDNIYSKYDDERLYIDSEFSTLFKQEDFKGIDIILEFDYSRSQNSCQMRQYKGLDNSQFKYDIFHLFANFTSNDIYLIYKNQECQYQKLPKKVSLNIFDIDTFWFYGFLKLPHYLPNQDDEGELEKYMLNVNEIKQYAPNFPNLPTLFTYINKETNRPSIIDIQFIEERLRFKLYKEQKFDKKRFGIIDQKYKEWNCENNKHGLKDVISFLSLDTVVMEVIGKLMKKLNIDISKIGYNDEQIESLLKKLDDMKLEDNKEKIYEIINGQDPKEQDRRKMEIQEKIDKLGGCKMSEGNRQCGVEFSSQYCTQGCCSEDGLCINKQDFGSFCKGKNEMFGIKGYFQCQQSV